STSPARGGPAPGRALRTIAERLTPAVVAMGSAADTGTPAARSRPYGPDDPGLPSPLGRRAAGPRPSARDAPAFTPGLAALLAAHDDALLAASVDGRPVPFRRLGRAL